MSKKKPEKSSKNKKEKIREYFDELGFYLIIIVFVIVLYIFASMSIAPLSTICSLCHGAEKNLLSVTGHNKLSCNTCHGGFTLSSRINFRFSLVGMPFYGLFGEHSNSISVDSETCLVCHGNEMKKTFTGEKGVRISHKELISEGYECNECHLPSAHGYKDLSEGYIDMFACLECHNGLQAPSDCKTCHPQEKKDKPSSNYTTMYQMVHKKKDSHGSADLNTCGVCHERNDCRKCHKLEIPHPNDFIFMHSRYAMDKKIRESCDDCHTTKAFCQSCHVVEMPHPDKYLAVHAEESRKNGENVCNNCHAKESCISCHAEHRHPGIPVELREYLRRKSRID